MKAKRSLVLGTAMWGWSVDEPSCFKLLDYFYKRGFRGIDTATNYPINKDINCFRRAENIIRKWIEANGIKDLKVIIKVGSLSNNGGPDNNLKKSFLLLTFDYYRSKFGRNLDNFMIHWDNRNSEPDIRESVEALKIISKETGVGLSGIKYPFIYAPLIDEFRLCPTVEIKHNIITSALGHYRAFKGKSRFLIYGINMGAMKRSGNAGFSIDQKKELQDIIDSSREEFEYETQTSSHLNMVYAYNTEDISGVIIGSSNFEQLQDSLDFWDHLGQNDTDILYSKIKMFADGVKSNGNL